MMGGKRLGKICVAHPELGGLRYLPSYKCVQCHKDIAKYKNKNDPNHAKRQRIHAREIHDNLKSVILAFYGPNCFRCGESDVDVLTLDHIDQNGAAHRRELGMMGRSDPKSSGPLKIYRWLINNYLPGGFRTACFNCNHKEWVEEIRRRRDASET